MKYPIANKSDSPVFWLVFRIGGGGPSVKHPTQKIAADEASRLAAMTPGCEFVVCRSVEIKKSVVMVETQKCTIAAGPMNRPIEAPF